MFNVCTECGEYRIDKEVDKEKSLTVRPYCGYEHPFERLPLFTVTGASGVDKKEVLEELRRVLIDKR